MLLAENKGKLKSREIPQPKTAFAAHFQREQLHKNIYIFSKAPVGIIREREGGNVTNSLVCGENHTCVISKMVIIISLASVSSKNPFQATHKLTIIKTTEKLNFYSIIVALPCVLTEYEPGRFERAIATHKIMSMAYLHWYGTNTFQTLYKYIMTTIVPARQIWSLRIVSFPRYRGNEPGYNVCMRGKICAATSLLPITSRLSLGAEISKSRLARWSMLLVLVNFVYCTCKIGWILNNYSYIGSMLQYLYSVCVFVQ